MIGYDLIFCFKSIHRKIFYMVEILQSSYVFHPNQKDPKHFQYLKFVTQYIFFILEYKYFYYLNFIYNISISRYYFRIQIHGKLSIFSHLGDQEGGLSNSQNQPMRQLRGNIYPLAYYLLNKLKICVLCSKFSNTTTFNN